MEGIGDIQYLLRDTGETEEDLFQKAKSSIEQFYANKDGEDASVKLQTLQQTQQKKLQQQQQGIFCFHLQLQFLESSMFLESPTKSLSYS